MTDSPYPLDFMDQITNVHFGGGGYCCIFLSGFTQPTYALPSGVKVSDVVWLPLSQDVVAHGYAVAVFGGGKFTFNLSGSFGDPTQVAPGLFYEVFTKPPFDRIGQKFFTDYQGTDQTLRIQFGAPPSQSGPTPDTVGTAPGKGNSGFIYRVAVDVSKLGHGTVSVTDVSHQGG